METKEIAQQVKLGAFVLGGLALFLVAVFFIGSENNIFSRTFEVTAIFRNVEGLKEGDNVWLSGVKIGTVTAVKIREQGKVEVTLSLKNNQHHFISRDATASVGSDGLVGNKIVVIAPGKSTATIAENDTLQTLSPTDTQDLMNLAKDVGENTRSLTLGLRELTERVNRGEGIVGELFAEGEMSRDLRSTINNLKQTTNNTAKATSELSSLIVDMRTGDGLLSTLVYDSAYARDFEQTLKNIKYVSMHTDVVAQRLMQLTAKMNDKDNAVGVLLQDSSFANSLRHTMQNTEEATRKLDENMEALQHNFLLRRYFRKSDKRKDREAASSKGNISVE
ncbi:MAG TPA: MlaD family protein [Chryseosolibacter sp.]|nr:MlaD family protein [Chryseosolibacter sp.]